MDLKRDFQGQLNLTRIASCSQESELRCAESCGVNRVLRARLGKLQIGVIEHVKEFGAKFQLGAFSDGEILEQGEVPYLIARPLNTVAAYVAE